MLKMTLEGTYEFLISMTSMMWVKFQKYWFDFSVILAIAYILDPRYKMNFVELCYKKAHGDDSLEILVVLNKLQSLFDEYKSKSSHPTTISISSRENEGSSHPESMEMESDLLKLYLDEPKMRRNVKLMSLPFGNLINTVIQNLL
ncbi:hypothetical protein UlMin_012718 [Ulmus minor]